MSHDRHSVGPYAAHLSAVNNTKPVTAAENIYDSKGLLLIKKGQQISQQAVERIVSVKLVWPIERSVTIDDAIGAARILTDIRASLPDADTRRIHDHYQMDAEIERAGAVLLAKEYRPLNTHIVSDAGIGEMAESVRHDRQALRDQTDQLRALVEGLPDLPHRSVSAAQRVSSVLTMAIRGSGVLDDGYVDWLKAVASQHQAQHYREVEDTRLLLDEVRRQVAKLTHLLHDIVDNEHLLLPLSKTLRKTMREVLAKLEPMLAKGCAA
jgi:hypothetical protein